MKRGVFDTLRRGLDNTFVNWPLLAIRVAEGVLFVVIALGAAIAILVPVLVSIGIELSEIATPDDVQRAAFSLLEKWTILLWIVGGLIVLALVYVLVHSFVEAGCARVYVDGERVAGEAVEGARARFRTFSMARWLAGARDGWWSVFWIYNLAWGVAGLILLIPLLPTLIITLVFREEPAVAITGGCLGLVLTLMLGIVVSIVTNMWTNRAIAEWATHGTGAPASLSHAWAALKADLGRHLLVAVAIVIVALAGSSFFAGFSFLAGFGQIMNDSGIFHLFAIPLRLAGYFLNTIFSAAVSSWALASYSALAVEGRRPATESHSLIASKEGGGLL